MGDCLVSDYQADNYVSVRSPRAEMCADNILADLPADTPVRCFTNFRHLTAEATEIISKLQGNGDDGNQYLVVLSLTKYAADKLLDDPDALGGVRFRFALEGHVGRIKVVPTSAHDCITDNLRDEIGSEVLRMGVPRDDRQWGQTTTSPGAVGSKAKQPDQCFYPGSRRPVFSQSQGYPTLVVETGVTESLPILRGDALWWFANSQGDTRMVLLMSVRRATRTIFMEVWQLAPPGTPRITRNLIDQFRSSNPLPMPPMVRQPAVLQQAYCIKELIITSTTVVGAPLILPFQAIFDRSAVGNEQDIVLNAAALMSIARPL